MKAQLDQNDELGWLLDLAQERGCSGACPKATSRAHARLLRERADLARLKEDNARLSEERDRERLRYGRESAKAVLLPQLLAHLRRTNRMALDEAKRWMRRYDEAGEDVRLEDFVTPHVNTLEGDEKRD